MVADDPESTRGAILERRHGVVWRLERGASTGVAKAAGRSGLSWIEVPRVAWNLYRHRVLRGWLHGRIGDC